MTETHTTRRIAAHGHRIHLREAGAGPLVLLLHGFPETAWSWRNQLGPLAEAGYHAVAIDMLGYGRSAKPHDPRSTTVTELVAVAEGVVETLGADEAVVVGHDWGAPIAWSAAWTRPEVFRAVVGVSVPFGGRGQMALPGSPFGERRPSEIETEIAGPDRRFYQQYFAEPGALAAEADVDVRTWLNSLYFSLSGVAPLPPYGTLQSDEEVVAMLRETAICSTPGEAFSASFAVPTEQPAWLTDEELDVYVEEFERSGFEAALHSYRTSDRDWELLAPYEGRPVSVPALFIGGDKDIPTLWGREAIARMGEHLPHLHDTVIIDDCGHWVQQEHPERFNAALLGFLRTIDGASS